MINPFLPGLLLRQQSGFYYVQTNQGLITCSIRGKMKQNRVNEDLVAIGDQVQISLFNTENRCN